MTLNRWPLALVSLLAFVLVGTGAGVASEANAPVVQPEATAGVPANVKPNQTVPPGASGEPATDTEVATVAEEGSVPVQSQSLLPAAPPPSLQTLVDERRDQLRERREAWLDAISGRYAYMSPWMAHYDRNMELYQDAMRQLHRRQRDYSQLYRDAWMDALHPWSRPQRNWSRIRSYLMQMEQLDRQEARDAWLEAHPYAFARPIPR